MPQKKYFLPLLFLLPLALPAQSDSSTILRIDSLLQTAWKTARTNTEQSLENLRSIEALYPENGEKHKEAVVLYYYGVFYKNLGEFSQSEAYFNRFEEKQILLGDTMRIAAVNMTKANLYSDQGLLSKSMEAATRALKLYSSLADTNGILSANSKVGYLLNEIGNWEEALACHQKSLEIARRSKNISEEIISNTNIALVYEKQKDYKKATEYYQNAYNIGETTDNTYQKVLNRYNLANIYLLQEQIDAAAPYARAASALSDSLSTPGLSSASKAILADVLTKKGQVSEALVILKSVRAQYYNQLGLRDQRDIESAFVEAYKAKGDLATAFPHLERLKMLNDSLVGLDSRKNIQTLSVQYETEKKEAEITLLNTQKQAAENIIQQKNRTIWIGGMAALLLMALSSFLYWLYRKYRMQKEALAIALQDRENLLQEIHHRVKNNLQIISSLLRLQSRHMTEADAVQALNEGEARVNSMAIIHHHLYTQADHLSQVNVQNYIRDLCHHLAASFNSSNLKVQIQQEVDPIYLDVNTMVPLGLILNELITNAYKYAFVGRSQGHILVRFSSPQAGALAIQVKDDGIGKPMDESAKEGFGSRLITTFLRKLEAEQSITIDGGTQIDIRLSISEK